MKKEFDFLLSYFEDIYAKIPSLTGFSFLVLSGMTRRSTRESINSILNYNFDNIQLEGFLAPLIIGSSAYFISKQLKNRKHEVLLYREVYHQSPSAIIITDREGRIEYVNPIFDKFFEINSQEVIGKEIDVIVDCDRFSTEMRLLDIIKGPGIWNGTFEEKKRPELFTEKLTCILLMIKMEIFLNICVRSKILQIK